MVDKAQMLIDELVTTSSMSSFNATLLDLMTVIPRSMCVVDDYMAKSHGDMQRICTREQSLLDSLRSKVVAKTVQTVKPRKDITILEAFGLKVTKASSDDINFIKKKLGSSASMFKNAWKVINETTEDAFQKYQSQADHKDTEFFWHGSPTSNWWGIMQEGLKIRKGSGVAHGTMFGHGIYFAPKAQKSIGYTSLHGSYWSGGRDTSGFLALYEVSIGKPYYVSAAQPYMTYSQLKKYGEDSVWAKAGSSLRNDEVIVYQEEQATIRFIVEVG